ncbi:LLM class flavin-dependent oxidoreductase [Rhizobium rhizogenes]|uniref:LLM class flavin-dependent oxidoreductase n=1 Tax=Rhizobium rhizogenes TaxID=359 RepID=UPI00157276D5|nr:LLM class flavin-dependent oxidoreductase [Rhizobium rhizogenes]NTI78568.1 LLM class flavin-dependent oxidoreductase [Rhizobium rhizogenes]
MPKKLRIGLSLRGIGTHAAGWRAPDAQADGHVNIDFYREMVGLAEGALLDMIFFADRLAIAGRPDETFDALSRIDTCVHLEPISLLSALAMVSSRIGLVSTASTTYYEPYHVARKFATLDHISHGRAGWNCVTSWAPAEALNFSKVAPPPYGERYARGMEFVEVVRGLWDSWDDDAFVRNKETGLFFHPDKVHVLDHEGTHFKVKGPLGLPRTPQGRPVIVQAGASDDGQEIAAKHADVIYAASQTVEEARAYYESVKGRMAKYGRDRDELKIMPGLTVITAPTEAEALETFEHLQEHNDLEGAMTQVNTVMGDMSGYDLDGPVPDPVAPKLRSRAMQMVAMARKHDWTLRQLAKWIATAHGHRVIVGTPVQVADQMAEWFHEGVLDGYNLMPPYMPGAFREFTRLVIPELQNRGLFRTEYEGTTLRENLGLERPKSRYA